MAAGTTAKRLDQIVHKLKHLGHRITPQRLAILETLIASDQHPSVEQIFERVKQDFPTTSLATVYKTVALAKELGEALELEFSQISNRYDARRPYPHPHVICTRCRRIIDPQAIEITDITRKISAETGFTIVSHRLDFFGICPQCRQDDRDGTNAGGSHLEG